MKRALLICVVAILLGACGDAPSYEEEVKTEPATTTLEQGADAAGWSALKAHCGITDATLATYEAEQANPSDDLTFPATFLWTTPSNSLVTSIARFVDGKVVWAECYASVIA